MMFYQRLPKQFKSQKVSTTRMSISKQQFAKQTIFKNWNFFYMVKKRNIYTFTGLKKTWDNLRGLRPCFEWYYYNNNRQYTTLQYVFYCKLFIYSSILLTAYFGCQLRGVTMGRMGSNIPQVLRGAPNDCGGAEKCQQCHKYFFQYIHCYTFASERPQVRTGVPNLLLAQGGI